MKPQVLYRQRLRQAENKSTTQMGAGSLMFATTENNILVLESGFRSEILFYPCGPPIDPGENLVPIFDIGYLPDIEIFCVTCTTATTEKTQSHDHTSN
jgi:hypothetical protein